MVNMYMAMKLRKLREWIGGAGAIGVVDEEQELLKCKGKVVGLFDKGSKASQVMQIAGFCQ